MHVFEHFDDIVLKKRLSNWLLLPPPYEILACILHVYIVILEETKLIVSH